MIIEGLLTLFQRIIGLLLTPINIPSLPEGVQTVMQSVGTYITQGLGLIGAFVHLPFLLSLFAIVVIIDAAMLIYKFIVWVLRKIPMAGME